jgi:general secretion pathway protein K
MARAALMPRPRGAAIVMAMLLAALAATIAATLLFEQQRWISDHEHRRDQVQAQALAMAGVQWARQIIYENAPAGPPVHLGQPWALRLPAIPIENGSIAGYIVDAQSRININNLATSTAQATAHTALAQLFGALALPPTLLNAITDWVDADNTVSQPGGAEDAWYAAQNPPGLAANAPVRRVNELLAVRGENTASVARMRPFVTAIDVAVPVNVNTAPPEVLSALVQGLDSAGAQTMVTKRTQVPFVSVFDFRARLPRSDMIFDDALVDVKSAWFEVSIEARQGETLARARALLMRGGTAGEWPAVVWQTVE